MPHAFIWDEKVSPATLQRIQDILKKENRPMLISEIAMKSRVSPRQIWEAINIPRAESEYGICVFDKQNIKWKKYIYKPKQEIPKQS